MNLVDFSIALLAFASTFVMKYACVQKEVYSNQVMASSVVFIEMMLVIEI